MGSEVQVLPGPYFSFGKAERKVSPGREREGTCDALRRSPACSLATQSAGAPLSCFEWLWIDWCGGLAQLVEHLLCKQGVSGSNPLASISPTAKSPGGVEKRPARHCRAARSAIRDTCEGGASGGAWFPGCGAARAVPASLDSFLASRLGRGVGLVLSNGESGSGGRCLPGVVGSDPGGGSGMAFIVCVIG